jgi:hypothetical protein
MVGGGQETILTSTDTQYVAAMKQTQHTKRTVSVVLQTDTIAALKAKAKAESRSVSGMADVVLRRGMGLSK